MPVYPWSQCQVENILCTFHKTALFSLGKQIHYVLCIDIDELMLRFAPVGTVGEFRRVDIYIFTDSSLDGKGDVIYT